jgi:hypothetical protein
MGAIKARSKAPENWYNALLLARHFTLIDANNTAALDVRPQDGCVEKPGNVAPAQSLCEIDGIPSLTGVFYGRIGEHLRSHATGPDAAKNHRREYFPNAR